ncbi:hypothetical protein ABW19_dt0200705 [Dactylella cylindrospora]|nr:hypothetical protein ABW19_dt0200705 [Dactylella cylindrospora]
MECDRRVRCDCPDTCVMRKRPNLLQIHMDSVCEGRGCVIERAVVGEAIEDLQDEKKEEEEHTSLGGDLSKHSDNRVKDIEGGQRMQGNESQKLLLDTNEQAMGAKRRGLSSVLRDSSKGAEGDSQANLSEPAVHTYWNGMATINAKVHFRAGDGASVHVDAGTRTKTSKRWRSEDISGNSLSAHSFKKAHTKLSSESIFKRSSALATSQEIRKNWTKNFLSINLRNSWISGNIRNRRPTKVRISRVTPEEEERALTPGIPFQHNIAIQYAAASRFQSKLKPTAKAKNATMDKAGNNAPEPQPMSNANAATPKAGRSTPQKEIELANENDEPIMPKPLRIKLKIRKEAAQESSVLRDTRGADNLREEDQATKTKRIYYEIDGFAEEMRKDLINAERIMGIWNVLKDTDVPMKKRAPEPRQPSPPILKKKLKSVPKDVSTPHQKRCSSLRADLLGMAGMPIPSDMTSTQTHHYRGMRPPMIPTHPPGKAYALPRIGTFTKAGRGGDSGSDSIEGLGSVKPRGRADSENRSGKKDEGDDEEEGVMALCS